MKHLKQISKKTKESGFTIIELVIASLILGLIAVSSLPLLTSSIQQNNYQLVRTAAFGQAQTKLESLRYPTNEGKSAMSCSVLNSEVGTITYGTGRDAYRLVISLPDGDCVDSNSAQTIRVQVKTEYATSDKLMDTVEAKILVQGNE